ncbi:hypothetical protein B9L19_14370 [Geobacillus thermocatenulatus]|uniref:Uncharacterized protein n=1 Tax=Geobacillus thermocatenulatus TaxID=33938 RepID=A0A226Q4J9_9BACL|nr:MULTISPECIES: hypothetical protein [Geobacillus]AST00304.1 hypothetical protein GT3921_15480 [Geobacillus thermocatenulatus]KLR72183.1 hypothetical protein ABH20_17830 [Geobacillus sp. T6]OXB86687.1 hypothetical protein B9L19_14370 [Geobacillus thermocatenulatus]RAN30062.1 hypothetical protein VC88_04170 [Geobacillus sp. A8]
MRKWTFFIKERTQNGISIKWIMIGAVLYFYSIILKKEIVQVAAVERLHPNNWDVTLRLVNDPYLIIYFIIPIVMFFLLKSIFMDFDYHILIRVGSFQRWIYYSLRKFWANTSPLLFVWMLVSLWSAIGFPFSWDWSELSRTEHFTNTLYELSRSFANPFFTFAAQFLLFLFTFSLLHIIFAIIYVLTQNKRVMILISLLFFVFSIIGFKLLPKEVAFLSPITFFSLANGANVFHPLIEGYIMVMILLIFCIGMLPFLDLHKRRYIQTIKGSLPLIMYVLLCVMGIGSTIRSLKKYSDITIWDALVASFAGVSPERFAYIPYFFYVVVFFGLIYLLHLFILNNEIEQLGYYKIIRFRSLTKWFWSWMRKLIIIIALFLFALAVVTCVLAACWGANIGFYATLVSKPISEIVYHFFVNGFLQMIFYIILIFIVSWISKESIYSIVMISILMVAMLPGVNVKGIIPVGLNSIIYLADHSPYSLTLILSIANVVSFSIIHYLFKQSLKI